MCENQEQDILITETNNNVIWSNCAPLSLYWVDGATVNDTSTGDQIEENE